MNKNDQSAFIGGTSTQNPKTQSELYYFWPLVQNYYSPVIFWIIIYFCFEFPKIHEKSIGGFEKNEDLHSCYPFPIANPVWYTNNK